MSTNHRWGFQDLRVLGTAKVTIATAVTTNFDFGTPNDINLAAADNTMPGFTYLPGDRLLAIMTATTAGTADSLTFSVQDAADNGSAAIGTPATAVTTGTLAMTTGDGFTVVGIQVQSGRPWFRFRVTSTGTTDTFVTHCTVLAVPSNV